MYISVKGYQNFYKHNLNFNKHFAVRNLVKEIFQTRDEGRIGYQMSTLTNFKNGRQKNILDSELINEEEEENQQVLLDFDDYQDGDKSIINYDILGVEEKAIFSYITNMSYDHIIISGALGSGKTALIKYLFKHLYENSSGEMCSLLNCCSHRLPSQIYIDFNTNYPSNRPMEIKELFKEDLYNKVSKRIIHLLNRQQLFDKVIEGIKNYEDYSNLDDYKYFEEEVLESNEWDSLTQSKKCRKIVNWIDKAKRKKDVSSKLKSIFNLLAFIINTLEPVRNECFIIAYDNIDRFKDEVQDELLDIIMGLSNGVRIKHLVTVRLTAFGQIAGNGSYSYGVFEHGGHHVNSLVSKRIKDYLDNKDSYRTITKDIPSEYLVPLNRRLEFICKELNSEESILSKSLNAIAGLSIRRGLFLAERFFLNSSLEFEKYNLNYNLFIRSLFVSESPECKIRKEDSLVSNIFYIPHNRRNSLLIFKILTVLNNAKKNEDGISMKELFLIMKNSVLFTQDDFFSAINYLIEVKKRLIYVNGISKFKNKTVLLSCDQRVSITNTGVQYIENLYNTVQYVQDCFLTINWSCKELYQIHNKIKGHTDLEYLRQNMYEKAALSPINIPVDFLLDSILKYNCSAGDVAERYVDYSSTYERFKFIRKAISSFVILDVSQIIFSTISNVFDSDIDATNFFNELTTLQIIVKISKHAYSTLLRENYFDELASWLNLLIIIKFWNSLLFSNIPDELNKIIDRVEGYLKTVNYLKGEFKITALNTF